MWWLRDSASNQSRARVLDRTRFWRSKETFSFFWSERSFSETTTPDSNHGASEDAPSSEGSWTSEKRDRWDLGHDVRVPQNETKIFTTDTCTLEQNVSRVEQTLPHSTSARHDASTFLPRRARRARFSSSLAVHRGMSCAAAASFHRRTRKSRDSTLGSPNHEEPNLVVPASPASLSHTRARRRISRTRSRENLSLGSERQSSRAPATRSRSTTPSTRSGTTGKETRATPTPCSGARTSRAATRTPAARACVRAGASRPKRLRSARATPAAAPSRARRCLTKRTARVRPPAGRSTATRCCGRPRRRTSRWNCTRETRRSSSTTTPSRTCVWRTSGARRAGLARTRTSTHAPCRRRKNTRRTGAARGRLQTKQ